MDKNTLSLLVHFLVFTFYFFLLLNPFTILDRSHRNSFSSDMFLKSPRVYFTKKKRFDAHHLRLSPPNYGHQTDGCFIGRFAAERKGI